MIGIIITPLALYQENNGWPNELPCTWWVGLGQFREILNAFYIDIQYVAYDMYSSINRLSQLKH